MFFAKNLLFSKVVCILVVFYMLNFIMSSKEYLLAVLDRVSDDRDLASWLQVLIQYGDVNAEVLDALVDIFATVIKDLTDTVKASKLSAAMSIVSKLKEQEAQDQAQTAEDIAALDDMIAQL